MDALQSMVAVVTGGSGGIGRAIAVALARQRAMVCVLGRDRNKLEQTAAEIGRFGGVVSPFTCNLAEETDVQKSARAICEKFSRVDVLVHAAGLYRRSALLESSLDDLDLLYRVNIRGMYALTQALLPDLIAARGQIVFVNSTQGMTAAATLSQYAATQHAKKAIADALREEVNSLGVRVISIFPGRTATAMARGLFEQEGREYDPSKLLQPSDISEVVTNALTVPKSAEVTNIFLRPMVKSY